MTVRGFTEETHSNYIREVRAFAAFIRRPPDTATAEDLRRFQLHRTQSGMQPPSINSSVSALRFFFTVTPRPAGPCPAAHGRAPAAAATGGAERGGDYASAPGGARAQVQGGIRYRLRRRAARLRGGRAQGRRYRLRAHAVAG
ncbi:MAG TPA: phage integrase N-terminal SAM-like domain-containing protein [Stellaceae bacterium]|nr:phage integrase N-terminal SAM-like domain-containing protein [Stellaceae bacterium]